MVIGICGNQDFGLNLLTLASTLVTNWMDGKRLTSSELKALSSPCELKALRPYSNCGRIHGIFGPWDSWHLNLELNLFTPASMLVTNWLHMFFNYSCFVLPPRCLGDC